MSTLSCVGRYKALMANKKAKKALLKTGLISFISTLQIVRNNKTQLSIINLSINVNYYL